MVEVIEGEERAARDAGPEPLVVSGASLRCRRAGKGNVACGGQRAVNRTSFPA